MLQIAYITHSGAAYTSPSSSTFAGNTACQSWQCMTAVSTDGGSVSVCHCCVSPAELWQHAGKALTAQDAVSNAVISMTLSTDAVPIHASCSIHYNTVTYIPHLQATEAVVSSVQTHMANAIGGGTAVAWCQIALFCNSPETGAFSPLLCCEASHPDATALQRSSTPSWPAALCTPLQFAPSISSSSSSSSSSYSNKDTDSSMLVLIDEVECDTDSSQADFAACEIQSSKQLLQPSLLGQLAQAAAAKLQTAETKANADRQAMVTALVPFVDCCAFIVHNDDAGPKRHHSMTEPENSNLGRILSFRRVSLAVPCCMQYCSAQFHG